jgi:hypothetical protein
MIKHFVSLRGSLTILRLSLLLVFPGRLLRLIPSGYLRILLPSSEFRCSQVSTSPIVVFDKNVVFSWSPKTSRTDKLARFSMANLLSQGCILRRVAGQSLCQMRQNGFFYILFLRKSPILYRKNVLFIE